MPPVEHILVAELMKGQQPKKPRHRHSPAQLAALNELYEREEHPSLEQRSDLAVLLRMEVKTVNAWFQNKRASKKKTTSRPTSTTNSSTPSTAVSVSHSPVDNDEYEEETMLADPSRGLSSSFYAGNPDHNHAASGSYSSRMRIRPTAEQTIELKKMYALDQHPSSQQRHELAAQIGMRYQSITNWFQNQRSLAKKRRDDSDSLSSAAAESRTYSAFPPPTAHPSLELPPASSHPSLGIPQQRRSPSISSSHAEDSSRRSRRSTTPYSQSRPRRTRPEPYQLNALKDLFTKTPTPSIEQRTVLANEIGMDLGKVTNWFRNLRQSNRKKARKQESDDDEAYTRSPSPATSSSSVNDDTMDYDFYLPTQQHSDIGSEEDYQEAVTPSPDPSPAPHDRAIDDSVKSRVIITFDPALHAEAERATKNFKSGVQAEDALLLLSFHKHGVI